MSNRLLVIVTVHQNHLRSGRTLVLNMYVFMLWRSRFRCGYRIRLETLHKGIKLGLLYHVTSVANLKIERCKANCKAYF